jgi:hypothetical protein
LFYLFVCLFVAVFVCLAIPMKSRAGRLYVQTFTALAADALHRGKPRRLSRNYIRLVFWHPPRTVPHPPELVAEVSRQAQVASTALPIGAAAEGRPFAEPLQREACQLLHRRRSSWSNDDGRKAIRAS